ncbi:HugZ heme iron utilization protein [Pyrenophora tritici-repentis]|nr:HugZ heme iron utilization protein [Pyrenophora tritici-repentis]
MARSSSDHRRADGLRASAIHRPHTAPSPAPIGEQPPGKDRDQLPMGSPNTQDEATRQRIIKHMNTDHHDSIRRYVEAFASKSVFQSRKAQMIDIDLNQMVISSGDGQRSVITFDPPMQNLREARERVVQLDKDAQQILGRSDIPVTTFIPTYRHPTHLALFTTSLLCFLLLPRQANWQPGSLLYDSVLHLVPGTANFVAKFGWTVVFLMLAHVIEAFIMVRKLARHGCTFLDAVWWKWVGTCLVEGFTSFRRLDALVEEKKREKEAKKH